MLQHQAELQTGLEPQEKIHPDLETSMGLPEDREELGPGMEHSVRVQSRHRIYLS
jgi:hypothetical protein